RHGFGYFLEANRLSHLLPQRRMNGASAQGPGSARGQRLREVLDELGPTFVKFGQLLSTRPDVVPPDIVLELRRLQDDVRPFPFAGVGRAADAELGSTPGRLFIACPWPIAAAATGPGSNSMNRRSSVFPSSASTTRRTSRCTRPRSRTD